MRQPVVSMTAREASSPQIRSTLTSTSSSPVRQPAPPVNRPLLPQFNRILQEEPIRREERKVLAERTVTEELPMQIIEPIAEPPKPVPKKRKSRKRLYLNEEVRPLTFILTDYVGLPLR